MIIKDNPICSTLSNFSTSIILLLITLVNGIIINRGLVLDLKGEYVNYPDLVESNLNWSMGNHAMEKLSNLIVASSIVINSGSTISKDALYHNKPVIMTSFDGNKKLNYWQSAKRLLDYTHLKKLISYGGISVARSQKEMEGLINKYLENSNYNYNQRYKSLKKELFDVDGNATNNVVNTLINN